MIPEINNKYFKSIDSSILKQFETFSNNHPFKSIEINNFEWKYIVGGQGNTIILQLPGGLRNPIYRFGLISELEKNFKIISPIYPLICKIEPLIDGITRILEKEQIEKVFIFGASFGGLLAQCFLHKFPDLVDKIIISNTGTTYNDKTDLDLILKRTRKGLKFIKILPKSIIRSLAIRIFIRIMKGSKNQIEMFRAMLKNEFSAKRFNKPELICHFKSLLDLFENYNFTENDLKDWKGEMFIISSDDDKGVYPGATKRLIEVYPRAKIYSFRDAGHSPLFLYPEKYISLIKGFYKGVELP